MVSYLEHMKAWDSVLICRKHLSLDSTLRKSGLYTQDQLLTSAQLGFSLDQIVDLKQTTHKILQHFASSSLSAAPRPHKLNSPLASRITRIKALTSDRTPAVTMARCESLPQGRLPRSGHPERPGHPRSEPVVSRYERQKYFWLKPRRWRCFAAARASISITFLFVLPSLIQY